MAVDIVEARPVMKHSNTQPNANCNECQSKTIRILLIQEITMLINDFNITEQEITEPGTDVGRNVDQGPWTVKPYDICSWC